MDRTLIAIGGGEIKNKETLGIDEYIANKAKQHAGENRAYGLFIPTASHDYMPYYNSFHKTYTGNFDIKTDVALTVFHEPDMEKLLEKFSKADFIYVGGGDTVYMIEQWKKCGLLPLILQAYERGVILCGLSAGAICWFTNMYTDSNLVTGDDKYNLYSGLNLVQGTISPHYNQRMLDFDAKLCYNKLIAYGIEDRAAIEFVNEKFVKSLTCGGNVYFLDGTSGKIEKKVL